MGVKVSVVIPVYNPGECIRPCIESVLAQTMPPGELEVIFVDDGSTDDTPELLDRLAEEHAHVHVVHQANSGWPGLPRNVGMDAATGAYVMFMDQDDALGIEAMQRMYDIALRNHADIVIGKVTSNFRGVPSPVWRTSIERCTFRDHMLIHSLTPHKMFRRDFLVASSIRHPEGRRRLEDQLFIVQTYLAAQCVSIVGNYPCYFYLKRADGGNIGSQRPDPGVYYGNLREILDIITSGVEPGAFRDSLLARFFQHEMLGRLDGLMRRNDWESQAIFREVRQLALEDFMQTVPAAMQAQHRVRAALVIEDRFDDLGDYAERVRDVVATATIENVHWRGGVLHADVAAGLVFADGSPLCLPRRGGRYVLDPRLVADVVPDDLVDVTDQLKDVTAEVIVVDRASGIDWFVPAEVEAVGPADSQATASVAVRMHIAIDPLDIIGGTALEPGAWSFAVRVRGCGLVRRSALMAVDLPAARREAMPALLGSPARTVVPRLLKRRAHIWLDIDESMAAFGRGMAKRLRQEPRVDRHGVLTAVLPAVTTPGTSSVRVNVELHDGRSSAAVAVVDGWLQPEGSDVVLRAQLPPLASVTVPRDIKRLNVMWRLNSSQKPATRLGHVSRSRRRFTTWQQPSDRPLVRRVPKQLAHRLRRRLSLLSKRYPTSCW